MCRHKSRRKHNEHFKLLFFTINLPFVTSDQLSTHRKLTLSLTGSIYLTNKTQADQNRPLVLLIYLKRNNPQTFKSGSQKNFFLQCVCKEIVTGEAAIASVPPPLFSGAKKTFFLCKIGVDEREDVDEETAKKDIGRRVYCQKSDA